MNSLFEIQGDVFAAHEVAAVAVNLPNEEEGETQWTLRVVLRGSPQFVDYYMTARK